MKLIGKNDAFLTAAQLTPQMRDPKTPAERIRLSRSEGLIFLLWLGGVARLCGPVVLFSVAPAPEFVVQDGGEHIDAAIVDGDCIGAECAS